MRTFLPANLTVRTGIDFLWRLSLGTAMLLAASGSALARDCPGHGQAVFSACVRGVDRYLGRHLDKYEGERQGQENQFAISACTMAKSFAVDTCNKGEQIEPAAQTCEGRATSLIALPYGACVVLKDQQAKKFPLLPPGELNEICVGLAANGRRILVDECRQAAGKTAEAPRAQPKQVDNNLQVQLRPSARAEGDPDLGDLLRSADRRRALQRLLEIQPKGTVPAWVEEYLRTSNGVVGGGKRLAVGGATYDFASVCEPHNCGGNTLAVLFAPDESAAWAILEVNGERTYLGDPGLVARSALDAGFER